MNYEQQRRIDDFKARYGRTWKTKLSDLWMNGQDAQEPDGHLLRQVRNQFGPDWLRKQK
jgi:hypothetical protein